MRLVNVLLGLITVTGLVVLAPSPAFACSCAQDQVAGYVDGAELVVRGTVEGRDDGLLPGGDDVVYRVAVEWVYVGEAGPVVDIHSAGTGDTCGLEVRSGDRYVLFAHGSAGEYSASLCGGTAPATPQLVAQVAEVAGPGTAPDPSIRRADQDGAVFLGVAAVLAVVLAVVLAWRFRRP